MYTWKRWRIKMLIDVLTVCYIHVFVFLWHTNPIFTDFFYLKKIVIYMYTVMCTFWFTKNQYFCKGHKPKLIISSRSCENDMTSNKPFNRYGSNLLIMLYNRKKLLIKCISSNFLWNGWIHSFCTGCGVLNVFDYFF